MGRPLVLLCVLAVVTGAHLALASPSTPPFERAPSDTLGSCSHPTERREWRTLTLDERAEWIRAVKCLANIRHPRLSRPAPTDHEHPAQAPLEGLYSLHDDFAYAHAAMDGQAHFSAYFLPWHRYFLHLFDNSLRSSCAYRGPTPYWDWSPDSHDLFSAPVFSSHPSSGLGTTGNCTPSADCEVKDGALTREQGFDLAWPVPHGLRRNLTLITGWFAHERPQNSTLSPASVKHALEGTQAGDFWTFQWRMTMMHNHVHNFVGGDLAGDCPRALKEARPPSGSIEEHGGEPEEEEEGEGACKGMAISFTPNDPLFWLHHAQLDRLWSQWQQRDPLNRDAFSGIPLVSPTGNHTVQEQFWNANVSVVDRMEFDRLSVPIRVRDAMYHDRGNLCYMYVDVEGADVA